MFFDVFWCQLTFGDAFYIVYKRQQASKDTKRRQLALSDKSIAMPI
jgi:hypothetical protein